MASCLDLWGRAVDTKTKASASEGTAERATVEMGLVRIRIGPGLSRSSDRFIVS